MRTAALFKHEILQGHQHSVSKKPTHHKGHQHRISKKPTYSCTPRDITSYTLQESSLKLGYI